MNNLKFRVYHKELQKFLPKDEWFINLDGELLFYDVEDGVLVPAPEELYIISRFTGLQDKNGKDIYEGDIIKQDKKNGIVRFENGRFCHNGESNYSASLYWTEVIGNIYQNPELLKGDK